jgi:hypothetical protein
MTSAPLHVDMDAYKVGPGGQTLGELKADVIERRNRFIASVDNADLEALETSIRMLSGAYVRLGLPYVAP